MLKGRSTAAWLCRMAKEFVENTACEARLRAPLLVLLRKAYHAGEQRVHSTRRRGRNGND